MRLKKRKLNYTQRVYIKTVCILFFEKKNQDLIPKSDVTFRNYNRTNQKRRSIVF
jgi:hypothetical protein